MSRAAVAGMGSDIDRATMTPVHRIEQPLHIHPG
jgi:hypothetical protein